MATTTLTGTTGSDILNAPGSVTSLVAGYQGNDTITLIKSDDAAQAGAGDDSISVNVSGAVNNTIAGGSGADTLYFGANVTSVGGSINLGAGDIVLKLLLVCVNLSVGGNAGSDTITFNAGALNTTVGGGANNDSIAFTAGTLTNVAVVGGGGADTLTMGALNAVTLSTVQSGDGHDRINATGLIGYLLLFLVVRASTASSSVLLVALLLVVLVMTPSTSLALRRWTGLWRPLALPQAL